MNTAGVKTTASNNNRPSSQKKPSYKPPKSRNRVLAERNPAIAAVGAWVEGGGDILDDPFEVASLTERLQAEKRREKREGLRQFQDEVHHRVAQYSQVKRREQQPVKDLHKDVSLLNSQLSNTVFPERKLLLQQIRRKLAACQTISDGEIMSQLPGGKWSSSPSRDKGEEVESIKEGDGDPCPLVQHDVSEPFENLVQTVPSVRTQSRAKPVLWPVSDEEELKRQRGSQFLAQRRHFLEAEREQAREDKKFKKHQEKTARIKVEKEQIRLQEEQRLQSLQQLKSSRLVIQERERSVLELLQREEEERRAQLEKQRCKQKEREPKRLLEAVRALRECQASRKLDLPPLCCCGQDFWDTHPDTCANNCVFYNNPKAYIQALRSTVSLDLKNVDSKH